MAASLGAWFTIRKHPHRKLLWITLITFKVSRLKQDVDALTKPGFQNLIELLLFTISIDPPYIATSNG